MPFLQHNASARNNAAVAYTSVVAGNTSDLTEKCAQLELLDCAKEPKDCQGVAVG